MRSCRYGYVPVLMQQSLQPFEAEADGRCAAIHGRVTSALERLCDRHVRLLLLTQYTALVNDAGLGALHGGAAPPSEALHAFLALPNLLISPERLAPLPATLPTAVHKAALVRVAQAYAKAYNGSGPAPDEVQIVLDVQAAAHEPPRALLDGALSSRKSM